MSIESDIEDEGGRPQIPDGHTRPEATSLMSQLATTIAHQTTILDSYFKSQEGPKPSFDADGLREFSSLPDDIQQARLELLRATQELQDLATGPAESLRYMAFNYHNQLSLNAMIKLKIVDSFPVFGTTTYAKISKSTGLTEKNVRRFTQHAMMHHILAEDATGVIRHTAASRALVEDPALRDWVGVNTEDFMPATTRTLEAMRKYPNSQSLTQTAFQLVNGTENIEPLFATLGKDPVRAKRFGNAMNSWSNGEGYEVSWVVDHYDWQRFNTEGSTVVDVGGSHGFACVQLAKKFSKTRYVVQELPKMIQSVPPLPEEVRDRITFQAHDFMTTQPVKDADVYFFRWIFHNLPNKHAIHVLKQLIPALKPGARIVINDFCLPSEPGQYPHIHEKAMRSMDLLMLTLLNSEERTSDGFEAMFRYASEGFRFVGVTRPKGFRMSIIEAVWEGEAYGGTTKTNGTV